MSTWLLITKPQQGQGTELRAPQAGSALDKPLAETTLYSDTYCVHPPSWHISAFQGRWGKLHMRNKATRSKAMILFSPGEDLRAKIRSKGKDCNCFHACLSYALDLTGGLFPLAPKVVQPPELPCKQGFTLSLLISLIKQDLFATYHNDFPLVIAKAHRGLLHWRTTWEKIWRHPN